MRLLSFASQADNSPQGLARLVLDVSSRHAGERSHVGIVMFDPWHLEQPNPLSVVRGAGGRRTVGAVAAWLEEVTARRESLLRGASHPVELTGGRSNGDLPPAAFGQGSTLWVPLIEGRRVIGGLHAHTAERGAWEDGAVTELERLAECALPALHRAILVYRLTRAGYSTAPLGVSGRFLRFEQQLRNTARHPDGPVLISGERGAGKEIAAWAVHCLSRRWQQPFVPVLVSALPESLYTAELFGHQRGAFTGATAQRLGRFASADGGTLFLDEVAEMSGAVQSLLLRVLERGEVTPVGGDLPRRVDVRVVAATNLDLRAKVKDGTFRADLQDRLRVLELRVPPLRERPSDIPVLANHYLHTHCRRLGRDHVLSIDLDCRRCSRRTWKVWKPCATREFFAALQDYPWPGNVRELRNVVLQALASAPDDVLDVEHLPARLLKGRGRTVAADGAADDLPLALEAALRQHIERVLSITGHNLAAAARLLEIPESTLRSKIQRLGVRYARHRPRSGGPLEGTTS